jgi:hypothetical protein
MGGKPKAIPEETFGKRFEEAMASTLECDNVCDQVFMAGRIGATALEMAGVEELTLEQWKQAHCAIQAVRQLCDVLLPEARVKVRTSETISWMKP